MFICCTRRHIHTHTHTHTHHLLHTQAHTHAHTHTHILPQGCRHAHPAHLTSPRAPLLAAGWSLGANILIKYLAEEGAAVPLTAAVSMCNPFGAGSCGLFMCHCHIAL